MVPLAALVVPVLLSGCTREFQLSWVPSGEFVEQIDGTPDPVEVAMDPDQAHVSTKGTRFAIAFLENLRPSVNGPPAFEVWVESDVETTGQLVAPATGLTQDVTIAPGLNVVPLPDGQLEPLGSGVVVDVGLELRTDDPVHAVGVHHRRFFTEATRLLPEQELGVNYRIAAVADDEGLTPSEFSVMALEDDTTVTITPSADTRDLRPANVPWPTVLQAGQVIQITSTGDLTGSQVFADQRVAVFSGGREPIVDCDAASHAWEQMPPTSRFATDWLVQPWPEQPYQYIQIVAASEGTLVWLDCEELGRLGPGESLRVRVEGPSRVLATRRVLVTQLAIGGRCGFSPPESRVFGDPNLMLATRTALHRNAALVEPLDHPTFVDDPGPGEDGEPVDLATLRRDRMVVWSPAGEPVSVTPPPVGVVAADVEDQVVEAFELDAASLVEGPVVRGFAYGVSDFNAYSYGLGYDCEDCGPDLAVPASCE